MAASFRGAQLRGVRVSISSGPTIPDALGGFFMLNDLFNQSAGSPQDVFVADPTPVGLFWDVVSGSPTLTGSALTLPTGSELRTQVINCDNSGGYVVFETQYTASTTDSVLVLELTINTTVYTLSIYGTTASGLQGKIQLVATDPNWTTPTYTVTTTGTVNYAGSRIGMMVGTLVAEIMVDGIPVVWQELPNEGTSPIGNGTFSISATGGTATYTIADAREYMTVAWTDAGNAAYEMNDSFTGTAGPIPGRYVAGATQSTYWAANGERLAFQDGSGGYVSDLTNPADLAWIEYSVQNVAYSNGFALQSSYTDLNAECENSIVYSIGNTQYTFTVTSTAIQNTAPGSVILVINNNIDLPLTLLSVENTTPVPVDYRGDDVRVEFQQSGIVVKVNGSPINMYESGTDTVFTGSIPFTVEMSSPFANMLVRPDASVSGSDTITVNYVQLAAL